MKKPTKLHVLLAVTEHEAATFKAAVAENTKFFKDKSEAFRGERRGYHPKGDNPDNPAKRGNKPVISTVDERLKWFEENHHGYIDSLLSMEATNASGQARAELSVDGESWGTFSSLELLRLKSLLENGQLHDMYSVIPARDESIEWQATSEEQYKNRRIFEGPKVSAVDRTTLKEQYILTDPNLEKMMAAGRPINYTPQLSSRDTLVELADTTHQRFSGEWSHRERAELLARKSRLLQAVIAALKVANDVEVKESELKASKIFAFLTAGKA